jgi:protein gp37
MGKHSTIEWTDHTFNPWWGCEKVSPACTHCYAETWARRVGQDVWGRKAPRRFFSDNHWREPLRWQKEAERDGERRRVFCASMADVFEDRPELNAARSRLWAVIERTSMLDWLLLTKRPQNVFTCVPWADVWPSNVWIGTTAEDQIRYDERAAQLALLPATVRFLSCEPLLGPIELDSSLTLDWVIVGGESGGRARPMQPDWARHLRDQCIERDVPFFFKQWGEWAPREIARENGDHTLIRSGKKAAGRILDAETWNQLPHVFVSSVKSSHGRTARSDRRGAAEEAITPHV